LVFVKLRKNQFNNVEGETYARVCLFVL